MTTFLYLLIAALIFFVIGYLIARSGCKSTGERYLADTPEDSVTNDDGSCEDTKVASTNEEINLVKSSEIEEKNASTDVATAKIAAAGGTTVATAAARKEPKEEPRKEEVKVDAPVKEEAEVGTGVAPEGLLSGPRGGKKDNLTRIKGIGVKIDAALNGIGIYHFDQIASWTEDNMAWADSELAFPGRAKRDNWVEQAKLLAEGKETEFSKRVDKGEVASSKKS